MSSDIITWAHTAPIQDVRAFIDAASDAYYNTEAPEVSDDIFDKVQEILWERDPISAKGVGAAVRGQKTRLPFWMGSMDKLKDEKALRKWISRHHEKDIVVSDKLDGVSALYYRGVLYSRGDGRYGQDISHLLPCLRLPDVPKTIAVRGELLLPRHSFQRARNVVSGAVNSKGLDPRVCAELCFVSYELITTETLAPAHQIDELRRLGFRTVESVCLQPGDVTIQSLTERLLRRKSECEFDIDGLILASNIKYERCKDGNPKYAVAFKVNADAKQTTVKNIEWNVSKDGILIPRIEFEPVEFDGVVVRYCTGHNARFIVENKVGPGSVVMIVRSGEVIPYLQAVVKPTGPELPPPELGYEWDPNNVHLVISSGDVVKQIVHFLKIIGVKHMDSKGVERLVAHGLDSIGRIIRATVPDIVKIDGIQTTSAERFISQVQACLHSADIATLMVASNQFSRGLGKKKIQQLLDGIPNLLERHEENALTVDQIEAIHGFSHTLGKLVLESIPRFLRWLSENGIKRPQKRSTPHLDDARRSPPLEGKKIVFSGFRDAELEAHLESQGAVIVSSISKKTDMLVVKDKSQSTSKTLKAYELAIPVVSVEEVYTLLKSTM